MPCATCGSEQAPGVRFCSNCGWAAAIPPPGRKVLAADFGSGTGQVAAKAGTIGAIGSTTDQTPLPRGEAPGATRAAVGLTGDLERAWARIWYSSPRLQDFVRLALARPGGLRGSALVAVVCLGITLVLWAPLSLPATWINAGVKWILPRSCEALGRFLLLENICSAAVGLMIWIGSVLVLGLLYLFRRQVAMALRPVLDRLPADFRFLGAPVLSAILFTIVWAGNSFHWWTRPGLVRDGLLPTLVGLMTHLMLWHGPGLQSRLAAWLQRRDRLSFKARLGLTFLVLYILSVWLTSSLSPAVSDQLLVIFGLVIGYLLLAPRPGGASGSLPQGADANPGQPRKEATG